MLCPVQYTAHHLLRRCFRQRDSWRASEQRKLFLPSSLDQLASRPRPRNPGLVHRDRWRSRPGCVDGPRRTLRRDEDLWRSQPAGPPRGLLALAVLVLVTLVSLGAT